MSSMPIMPLRVHSEDGAETPLAGDPEGQLWNKVPRDLRKAGVPRGALDVLSILYRFVDSNGDTSISNWKIADELAMHPDHVARLLRLLDKLGIIARAVFGPRRTIHVNKGFHERDKRSQNSTLHPGASAGVDACRTPAQAPGYGGASAGVDACRTPAQAPPSIRVFNPEEKKALEGESASAGRGQGPPPPPPRGGSREKASDDPTEGSGADQPVQPSNTIFIPNPFGLPGATELPPGLARFIPAQEIPAGVGPARRRVNRSPGGTGERATWRVALSRGDLMSYENAVEAKLKLNSLDPNSDEHRLTRVEIFRHNRAFIDVQSGINLPPGRSIRDEVRVIDITPLCVVIEPGSSPLLGLEMLTEPDGVSYP